MTAPIVPAPGWQTVGDLRFDADFTVAGGGIRPAGQLWERLAELETREHVTVQRYAGDIDIMVESNSGGTRWI